MFSRLVLKSAVLVAMLLVFLVLVSPALAQGNNNNGTNDVGNNNNGNNDIGNNNNGNNDIGNNNNGNNDIGNNNNGNNDIGNNNNGNNDIGDNNTGDNKNNGDPVPEIDPGSAAGALTLLASGVLLLTDKRRKKAKAS